MLKFLVFGKQILESWWVASFELVIFYLNFHFEYLKLQLPQQKKNKFFYVKTNKSTKRKKEKSQKYTPNESFLYLQISIYSVPNPPAYGVRPPPPLRWPLRGAFSVNEFGDLGCRGWFCLWWWCPPPFAGGVSDDGTANTKVPIGMSW